MQEIAVVQGLQAEVAEQVIAFRLQGCGQAFEVVVFQARVEQFGVDPALDEAREVVRVSRRESTGGKRMAEDFADQAGKE